MGTRDDLSGQIATAESRLAALAARSFPAAALSDPDPGAEERWDAPRIWAHIAEFTAYWPAEAGKVLAARVGEQPPIGRLASDRARSAAVERDRSLGQGELWSRIREHLDSARAFVGSLSEADLQRRGMHPRRGPVTVDFILHQFLAVHLDEHAEQLEGLLPADRR
jgi:hypothetical protein